jgi:4-diphosphocytidyl-2-C-methyl-D-erythritol kinase
VNSTIYADDQADYSNDTLVVHCPAKTNLSLKVSAGRNETGNRHTLHTLYCGLSLMDTILLRRSPHGSGFTLTLQGEHLGDLETRTSNQADNHALRALLALAKAYGKSPDVCVTIIKRIPVGAGLGGGSADAAGMLLGLNELWNLHASMDTLETIAIGLGADMPFCLHGGLAYGTGFGEQLAMVEESSEVAQDLGSTGLLGETLIGAYQQRLPTVEVYGAFDRLGSNPDDMNALQHAAVTLHPRSRQAIDLALAAGATHAFVSGSGPSVIACVNGVGVAQAVREAWLAARATDWILAARSPARPQVERRDIHELASASKDKVYAEILRKG